MKYPLLLCSLLLGLSHSFLGQSTTQQEDDPFAKLQKPIPELPAAPPASVGMNPDTLSNLIHAIRTRTNPDFRGLVVIKDDQLVVEEYFNTFWRDNIVDIRSAGKSITALLMGIAIDQGLVKDVNQSVYDFFPKHKVHIPLTEAHRNITIKHLLMMSSGLDADTDNIDSPGNGIHLVGSDDWLDIALNLPIAFESGSKWVYNDVCAMLTGAIIQQVSGKSLAEFAKEHLFSPLGIEEWYWYKGPNNITGAMGNLYLSTLDFAKIGYVVLNDGKWDGQQIVSASWIDEMLTKHLDISSGPAPTHYGYMWYMEEMYVKGKLVTYAYASGNGGNKLYVIPDLNAVLAITSSAYGQGYGHGRANNILIRLFQ